MKSRLNLILLALAVLLAGRMVFSSPTVSDTLFWPASAHGRIEKQAAILRRIEGPAKWCYPSGHIDNLLVDPWQLEPEFDRCVVLIEPASAFLETEPGYYVKRFYRAATERYICEVTLSTVRNDDRVVGADCYYGLFDRLEKPQVGVTDDPFG